jgi:hypothetical protein
MKCAITCAQKGHRLAIVTAQGAVYVVTGDLAQDNNARLIPLIGKTIVITGTVREEDVVPGEDNSGPGGGGSSGPNDLGSRETNTLLESATSELAASGKEDDKHKNSVRENEVIVKVKKKGDFREGDARAGSVKIIDAGRVEIAPPPPVR